MSILGVLIPVSLLLGLIGLATFIWSIRSNQFEDLEGDQNRAIFGDDSAPRD